MIKLCHVANSGAAVRFLLLYQLKLYRQAGYEVWVACAKDKHIPIIEQAGIRVVDIPFARTLFSFSHAANLVRLWAVFRKEQFDVVHTHNPIPGLLGQVAAKLAAIPVKVNTVHGFYFTEHTPRLKRRFLVMLEKISAGCADFIFSQNGEDVETARAEGIAREGQIGFLGNGVDLERFAPGRYSDEWKLRKRAELGVPKEAYVIGIVARMVKEKGYQELLGAFRDVAKAHPDAVLLVVGRPEPGKADAISLQEIGRFHLGASLKVLGDQEKPEEIYAVMDAFVLPSWREGFPRSVMEASAMGKPVVATDIRGCREAVVDGKTGILVPLRDEHSLAKALLYLIEHPDRANAMGAAGREYAREHFDERLIARTVQEKYKELLSVRGSAVASSKIVHRIAKRAFDVAASVASLILLSPLFLIIALLIKLESPGPIFFLSPRAGYKGKLFSPYKFRTMADKAMSMGLRHNIEKDDPRITRLGNALRTYGLDELPQIINVLIGEMSIVGPRPALAYQSEQYTEFQKKRLSVKPGITGWAVIHGRNSLTWEERFEYDAWYADHWNFWLDMFIIMKTPLLVFKKQGVFGKEGVNDDPFAKKPQ